MVEYAWRPSSCDPCSTQPPSYSEMREAGFSGEPRDAFFTRLRMRYTPEAGTQDITLYTSGIADFDQIRYIDYNAQMEDRHPVCGVGMVEDPGSCYPDGDHDGDADTDNEWDRTSESAVEGEEGNGGCSTTRASSGALGLSLTLGLAALFRRRGSVS